MTATPDMEKLTKDFEGLPKDQRRALLGKLAARFLGTAADTVEPKSTPILRREPWQAACSFNHVLDRKETGRRTLMTYPQSLFRGEGLWLWGVDDTTLVHNIKVGNQTCYEISGTPMPGRFFESNLTFEQFEKLLDPPEGGWQMPRLRELPPIPNRQRIRMHTSEVGNNIVLDVEGPITHAVMWGLTVH